MNEKIFNFKTFWRPQKFGADFFELAYLLTSHHMIENNGKSVALLL